MKKYVVSVILVISILLSMVLCGCGTVKANAIASEKFSDIMTSHWAYDTIDKMTNAGIINGYPDGTVRPEGIITRAEFVTLLANWLNFPLQDDDSSAFGDVGGWYAKSVIALEKIGVIASSNYGTFAQKTPISRIEMMRMMARLFQEPLDTSETIFTDDLQMTAEERGYVNLCVDKNIIVGYPDGSSGIHRTATRAEALTILYNLFAAYDNYNKIIAPTTNYKAGAAPVAAVNGSYNISNYSILTDLLDQKTYYNRRQNIAHNQAEWARYLGWSENCSVIKNASAEYKRCAEQKASIDNQYKWWVNKLNGYPCATYIYCFLRDHGFTAEAASGVIGNMMMETSYMSMDLNPCIYDASYSYYGLCMWSLYWAPGAAGLSVDGQLQYLLNTMPNEFSSFGYLSGYSFEGFKQITNPEAAALAFAQTYERCGEGSYYTRQVNARTVYNYYN